MRRRVTPTPRVVWLLPTISAAAMLSCNDNKLDQDGDGFTELTGDCDDLDANVHPEAQEVCYNGIDDNCNGVEDEEEATSGRVWYADLDGDGFGDNGITIEACEQPDGYAENKWDCNESDAAINPAADEICDYVDNDCDGEVDETTSVDASIWYPDRDGDGYGDADAPFSACEAPVGYVADGGDCNDSDPGMSPDRTEVCTTPLDEDCDGSINDLDAYGCTDFYGDLDGDGYPGTVACLCEAEAPYTDTEATDCDDTRSDVYPGAVTTARFATEDCGTDRSIDLSSPDATIMSDARYRGRLFAVEQLRADGVPGVLALAERVAAAWLDGPLLEQTTLADVRFRFPSPGVGQYGYMVSAISDLDGDGTRDFAWGWTGDETHPSGMYFFSGAASGDLTLDDAIGFVGVQIDTGSLWYRRVLATADFDGDGQHEVYIRDTEQGPTLVQPGLATTGTAEHLGVPEVGGTIGIDGRAFDVNGDGQMDLVLSGHQSALEPGFMEDRPEVPDATVNAEVSGSVLVYEGPLTDGLGPVYWVYGYRGTLGSDDSDFAFFDRSGDGIPDLLMSRNWERYLTPGAGAVWGLDGPIETTMDGDDWASIWDAELWLSGVEKEEGIQYLHPLTDITGDGKADLLVRAYQDDNRDGNSYFLDRFVGGHQRITDLGRVMQDVFIAHADTIPDQNGDGVDELMLSVYNREDYGYDLFLYLGDAP